MLTGRQGACLGCTRVEPWVEGGPDGALSRVVGADDAPEVHAAFEALGFGPGIVEDGSLTLPDFAA